MAARRRGRWWRARSNQSDRDASACLMNRTADDPEASSFVGAFAQGLAELGWTIGRNVRIEYRWGANDADLDRIYAPDLVALAPDVILAAGTVSVAALQRVTRTLPIVFVTVTDPVGAGFVDSLARPGGNTTGFTLFEYSLSGKWLELLKQIAPGITRVAVLRDPANPAGSAQFAAIQAVAQSLGVEVSPFSLRDGEIERAVTAFAVSANGGLIVTGSASATRYGETIIKLAARHKLPAVYPNRFSILAGGLICYGPDRIDHVPARSRLYRPHPQGREAGRPAGASADQIRASHQPQDRQGTRARSTAVAARPRRRGDRMRPTAPFARLKMLTAERP